jgi:hypothetical protein
MRLKKQKLSVVYMQMNNNLLVTTNGFRVIRKAAIDSGVFDSHMRNAIIAVGDMWDSDTAPSRSPSAEICQQLLDVASNILRKYPELFTMPAYCNAVIDKHTSEGPCLFVSDTTNAVMDELKHLEDVPLCDKLGEVNLSLARREIYCPDEGIDRRAEFGIPA